MVSFGGVSIYHTAKKKQPSLFPKPLEKESEEKLQRDAVWKHPFQYLVQHKHQKKQICATFNNAIQCFSNIVKESGVWSEQYRTPASKKFTTINNVVYIVFPVPDQVWRVPNAAFHCSNTESQWTARVHPVYLQNY